MSRLDSAIRRLQAQRACLELGVRLMGDSEGPLFELGLGNGRTYDHLRELCPEREIFVFDRKVAAHPDCVPDAEHLMLGEVQKTLPQAIARFGPTVPLVHADIGSGDSVSNAVIAAFVASQLPALLRPGGIVVADQAMPFAGAEEIALPEGVQPGRYFIYRQGGGAQ